MSDFGPTLAAEHLAERRRTGSACRDAAALDGGGRVVAESSGGASPIGSGGNAKRILASWCRWTAAFMSGWKSAAGADV